MLKLHLRITTYRYYTKFIFISNYAQVNFLFTLNLYKKEKRNTLLKSDMSLVNSIYSSVSCVIVRTPNCMYSPE